MQMSSNLKIFASIFEADAYTAGSILKAITQEPISAEDKSELSQYLRLSGMSYIATNTTNLFNREQNLRCVCGPGAITQFLRIHLNETAKRSSFRNNLYMIGAYLSSVFGPITPLLQPSFEMSPAEIAEAFDSVELKYGVISQVFKDGREGRLLLMDGAELKKSASILLPDKMAPYIATITIPKMQRSFDSLENTLLECIVTVALDAYYRSVHQTDWRRTMTALKCENKGKRVRHLNTDILTSPLCSAENSVTDENYRLQLKAASMVVTALLTENEQNADTKGTLQGIFGSPKPIASTELAHSQN